MTKKVLWLIISCLMALSLVMASCGPAVTEEEEEEEEEIMEEEEEEEEEDQGAVVTGPEEPKYGGSLRTASTSDVINWDEAYGMTTTLGGFTHNEPAEGDWAKGPTGSGEAD